MDAEKVVVAPLFPGIEVMSGGFKLVGLLALYIVAGPLICLSTNFEMLLAAVPPVIVSRESLRSTLSTESVFLGVF